MPVKSMNFGSRMLGFLYIKLYHLGKLFNISKPQFLHLKDGENVMNIAHRLSFRIEKLINASRTVPCMQ